MSMIEGSYVHDAYRGIKYLGKKLREYCDEREGSGESIQYCKDCKERADFKKRSGQETSSEESLETTPAEQLHHPQSENQPATDQERRCPSKKKKKKKKKPTPPEELSHRPIGGSIELKGCWEAWLFIRDLLRPDDDLRPPHTFRYQVKEIALIPCLCAYSEDNPFDRLTTENWTELRRLLITYKPHFHNDELKRYLMGPRWFVRKRRWQRSERASAAILMALCPALERMEMPKGYMCEEIPYNWARHKLLIAILAHMEDGWQERFPPSGYMERHYNLTLYRREALDGDDHHDPAPVADAGNEDTEARPAPTDPNAVELEPFPLFDPYYLSHGQHPNLPVDNHNDINEAGPIDPNTIEPETVSTYLHSDGTETDSEGTMNCSVPRESDDQYQLFENGIQVRDFG